MLSILCPFCDRVFVVSPGCVSHGERFQSLIKTEAEMKIYKLTQWTTNKKFRQIEHESVSYHRTYEGAVVEARKWVQYDYNDGAGHMWTTPRPNPMAALIDGAPKTVIYHAFISQIEVQD